MKKKISRKRAEIAISLICVCILGIGVCSGVDAVQNDNGWYIISTIFITISLIYGIIIIIRNIDDSEADK